jgi:hypothetical protein
MHSTPSPAWNAAASASWGRTAQLRSIRLMLRRRLRRLRRAHYTS